MRMGRFMLYWCCLAGGLSAQDLHFSQFYHHPMHYSPALTGAQEGDVRAMALARSQWESVPVAYRSVAVGADKKVWQQGAHALAIGVLLQGDRAGDAGLSWVQAGFALSVAQRLGARQYAAVGICAAVAQRQFDISALKFGNQWTGDAFDPALPSRETFQQTSGIIPSLGAGLSWRTHSTDYRSRIAAAIGAFHLNRPSVSFREAATAQSLPIRWAGSIQATQRIHSNADAVLFGGAGFMGSARETVVGGGARLWLKPEEAAVRFTLAVRVGDALIPAVQVELGDWTIGLSYDWNRSDFQRATRGYGGLELAAVYQPLPAPPMTTPKSCPVF